MALTPEQTSAKGILQAALAEFGLQSLTDWAWNLRNEGMPLEQLFGIELRKRPEYQARFPAMAALSEKGRAITEAAYISYEQQAVGVMRAAGLPEGFYDTPADFAQLLTNEVSVAELQSRVQIAQTAAFSAPVEDRAELERLYGIGPGDLVAYWLDPDRALPILEQRFVSAQIGASSRRAGYGLLTGDEAERLTSLGLDPTQTGQAFGELAGMGEVFGALTRGEEEIGRETQLGVVEGSAGAVGAVQKKQKRRLSEFEGGGGFAASEQGFSGAGSARR